MIVMKLERFVARVLLLYSRREPDVRPRIHLLSVQTLNSRRPEKQERNAASSLSLSPSLLQSYPRGRTQEVRLRIKTNTFEESLFLKLKIFCLAPTLARFSSFLQVPARTYHRNRKSAVGKVTNSKALEEN